MTALPAALYIWRHELAMAIIPVLLVTASLLLILLLVDRRFEKRRLWLGDNLRKDLRTIAVAFIPLAALMALGVWLVEPDRLLELPRERPALWLTILVAYPLASAYPQELIFRTFLFHRYAPLLGEKWAMILFSAVAFGLAHAVLANWIAIVLSTLGGLIFAATYARTRSTLMAAIEHGLWGDFVFTVGLGWYFYAGSVLAGG